MLDSRDFRLCVIRPTLIHLDLWSDAAEILLLGTAITESGLRWLKQKKGGPGLGIYQIEKTTHDDVWKTYLNKLTKVKLKAKVTWVASRTPLGEQLIHNLAYATAIARVIYWRKPEALPKTNDVAGLAKYWKDHYNTHLGAGKEEDFIRKLTPHL